MKCQGTTCTSEKLAESSEQEAEVIAWGGRGWLESSLQQTGIGWRWWCSQALVHPHHYE